MITLITGGPGLGKTALAVKLLIEEFNDRPIFTNVNGLVLPHEPLPALTEWTTQSVNGQGTVSYHFGFPPGSVILIDEAQHFFRPRSAGSAVPPYVQAFETHRHKGIDFILTTQGSRLLDVNLRTLVKGGRHILLRSSFLGRYRHEKSDVIDEESKTSIDLSSRRRYSLPKEVFPLYVSSELHTKPPKPRLPWQAYAFVFSLLAVGGLGWKAYLSTYDKTHPGKPMTAAQPRALADLMLSASMPLREALTPTDTDNPLSAPMYAAHIPEPVLPLIRGCVASSRKCTCYTDQSAPVFVPNCRERAEGHFHDPYQAATLQNNQSSDLPPTQPSGRPDRATGSPEGLGV